MSLDKNPATDLIAHSIERWKLYDNLEESTLLRLSILRDLMRLLHAEKSRCLALAMKDEVKSIKEFETRIEPFMGAADLNASLEEILSGNYKVGKRTRLLPKGLLEVIPEEKFKRFDRVWELAMAAEAASIGWQFWSLETWVEIAKIEQWNQTLGDTISPKGIILFSEAGIPQKSSSPPPAPNLWYGRWIVILHPATDPTHFPVGSFDGTRDINPKWKLLFSITKR